MRTAPLPAPRTGLTRLAGVVLAAWALAGGAAVAQPPVAPVAPFWQDDRRMAAGGAAEVVGIDSPLAALAMRWHGKTEDVWGEVGRPEPIPDRAPDLDPALLGRVQDNKMMPRLSGRLRDEWKGWEAATYDVFCQALRNAALTPEAAEVFKKSALENKGVTWGDLYREPKFYRGRVIPMRGRLKMLRKRDAPPPVERDGIRTFYEGWVFTETPGANPVCVDFIDLPKGVEVGERVEYRVTFDGYFLMRYRYLTSGRGWRDTLLFVAPTVTPRGPAREPAGPEFESTSGIILLVMGGVIAGTVLFVAGLGWWFHRGDRRFHRHLEEVRAGMFHESGLAQDHPAGDRVTGVRPEAPTPEGPPPP